MCRPSQLSAASSISAQQSRTRIRAQRFGWLIACSQMVAAVDAASSARAAASASWLASALDSDACASRIEEEPGRGRTRSRRFDLRGLRLRQLYPARQRRFGRRHGIRLVDDGPTALTTSLARPRMTSVSLLSMADESRLSTRYRALRRPKAPFYHLPRRQRFPDALAVSRCAAFEG